MKLGFLYAGQGSQHPGMGKDLYDACPAFRQVLDHADPGFDLKTVSFQDPDGVLNETRYTQPCMVAFAAGVTAVLREQGIVPAAVSGLSLGEYSALHAAGVLDAETAIRTAAFRGSAMEQAAQGYACAMMAVLGLDEAPLRKACEAASSLGCVVIANDNCPGQLVIGGEKAAVECAAGLAKQAGARRCLPLKVSGPFHTPLMAPAGDALAEYFPTIPFHAPKLPVLFNCLGGENRENLPIPDLLVRQVQTGVRMRECIAAMGNLGLDALVEIGPGRVLSGFVKKILPGFPMFAVETLEDVNKLAQTLARKQEET